MHNLFEKIRTLPGLAAAGLVAPDGALVDWCANTALDPRRLQTIGGLCRQLLHAAEPDTDTAEEGLALLGDSSLLFRQYPQGIFLAHLNHPVDAKTADWFWGQIDAYLREY